MIQHSGDSALFSCLKMEQDDITVAGKDSFLGSLVFSSEKIDLSFYPNCSL